MKFLYLIEWNFNGYSGVERKMRSQMVVWNKLGYSVKAIVIGKHTIPDKKTLEKIGFEFWHIPDNRLLQWLFLDQLIKQFYFILVFWRNIFQQFSFVYYRVSTLSLAVVFIARYKFVVEINSIDTEASKGLKKKIAPLAHYYRKLIFRSSACFFFITNELQYYYVKKYGIQADKSFVLGNGYWNTEFSESEIAEYFSSRISIKRKRPVLLFIGSGDESHYWHGYDKLIQLVKTLPEFDFILVGETRTTKTGDFPNLEVINKIFKKDILKIFQRSDIGIGTLALHRKKMQEASPLKVVEYVFFGLPVITAYHDVNIWDKPFNLELDNIEDNINNANISAIRSFVSNYYEYTLTEEERASVSLVEIERKRGALIKQFLKP